MWHDVVHYVTYRALQDGFMHTFITVSRLHKNSPASLSATQEVRLGEEVTLDLFLSHRWITEGLRLCSTSARPAGTADVPENRWTHPAVDAASKLLQDAINLKRTLRQERERWLRSCQGSTRLHESPQHDVLWKAVLRRVKHDRYIFLTSGDTYCPDGYVNYLQLPLQCIKCIFIHHSYAHFKNANSTLV